MKPAAKGLRRFKPYPVYKDSGVEWLGEIPAHWEVKRLKRVFYVVNGSTPASAEPAFWDGDISWVTPEDLGDLRGPVIRVTRRNITEAGYHSCGTTLVPADSLVLSTRAPIGHLALAGVDLCTNQGCRSLVFRSAESREFFFYELLASRPELESLGQGSTFSELAKGMLEDVGLVEPPESEQRAIAAFLDRETARSDALVAKKERLIELLQEKRTALITRAVTKGLDPNVPMKDSGVEWLGEIPADWDLRKLKHVCERVFVGIAEAATFAYVDDGVPMLRSTDVRANRIRTDDIRYIDRRFAERLPTKQLRTGDIVTVRTGNAGVSAVVPAEYDGGQCFTLVVSRPKKDGDSRYFCYWLNAPIGQQQFVVEGVGTAQINISVPIVQNMIICVPPPAVQIRIADFVDRELARWDALISKIDDAIDRLKELRTALISAAVTGKIDVREEAA